MRTIQLGFFATPEPLNSKEQRRYTRKVSGTSGSSGHSRALDPSSSCCIPEVVCVRACVRARVYVCMRERVQRRGCTRARPARIKRTQEAPSMFKSSAGSAMATTTAAAATETTMTEQHKKRFSALLGGRCSHSGRLGPRPKLRSGAYRSSAFMRLKGKFR